MRLERPRRRLLGLALLGAVLALLLGAVNVEMTVLRQPWNPGIPRNAAALGGSAQAASCVRPGVIFCMLKLFLDAPASPGRPTAEDRGAL